MHAEKCADLGAGVFASALRVIVAILAYRFFRWRKSPRMLPGAVDEEQALLCGHEKNALHQKITL